METVVAGCGVVARNAYRWVPALSPDTQTHGQRHRGRSRIHEFDWGSCLRRRLAPGAFITIGTIAIPEPAFRRSHRSAVGPHGSAQELAPDFCTSSRGVPANG